MGMYSDEHYWRPAGRPQAKKALLFCTLFLQGQLTG
jgi:hypothetical protein